MQGPFLRVNQATKGLLPQLLLLDCNPILLPKTDADGGYNVTPVDPWVSIPAANKKY